MMKFKKCIVFALTLFMLATTGSTLVLNDTLSDKGIKSLYLGDGESQDEEIEVLDGDYINIDDKTLNEALVDNAKDSYDVKYVSSINEIYGTKIDESKLLQVAKIQIASNIGIDITDFSNIDSVKIESSLELYDANDINSTVAYNFSTSNNEIGYIVLSKHTRAPLIREMVIGKFLPINSEKTFYFSEGEFYFVNGQEVRTLDGGTIDFDEFQKFKKDRVENYYDYTIDMLSSIEIDTISMLNNITYLVDNSLSDPDEQLSLGTTTYDGQDGSGYGGITSPTKYLADRYGGTITKKSSKSLSMSPFTCDYFSEENNCTLVAITRILDYYYDQGYTKLPNSYYTIYNRVLKIAKNYGFTEEDGTFPTKINNIIDDVLDYYGYSKSYSDGIYVWSFGGEVKDEIDNNRPVVMNIARGYYGNHSVTVCGYAIYKSKHDFLWTSYTKTHDLIRVYDGWTTSTRYIDYEAFAYDLISSGFGSFNTIIMKK